MTQRIASVLWSRDSSVDTMTSLWDGRPGFDSRYGQEMFFPPLLQDLLWGPHGLPCGIRPDHTLKPTDRESLSRLSRAKFWHWSRFFNPRPDLTIRNFPLKQSRARKLQLKMSDSDDDIINFLLSEKNVGLDLCAKKRVWVHEWHEDRSEGQYRKECLPLQKFPIKFREYYRLKVETFDYI
jgi:hypothetical protein